VAGKTREQRLSAAFVAVADTLVTGFDLIDQMRTLVDVCVDLLDVEAAGLLLLDGGDTLQLLVATSEQADFVEVLQLDAGAGPCVDCFTTGSVVAVDDIGDVVERWPEFAAAAAHRGFRSVYAVPMRLRGQVLGTLNLFSTKKGALNAPDAAVAQALADVATIGIIQERSIRETGLVTEQLQHALRSRVVIEQAKGVLSATAGMDVDEAFEILRRHARQQNLSLQEVAADVAARILYLSRDGAVVRS
jgi:GAF domain-containing protein